MSQLGEEALAEVPTVTPEELETTLTMLDVAHKDNAAMRQAGTKLAEAALHVIREHDGLHRLSLAVAEWAQTLANEGGRPH